MAVKKGDIVRYKGVRGQIMCLFVDNPRYAKVCTFPQDVGRCEGRHYERWPIDELEKVNS